MIWDRRPDIGLPSSWRHSDLSLVCCSFAKSCPTLCDPWAAACQASMSFTISQRLLKFMLNESVMPLNHLIFCYPLLLLPSIFLSIRVLSNELTLHIKWPKYWSLSFSISPSNEYSGLISFRTHWFISLLSKSLSRVFSSITNQKHKCFGAEPSLESSSHTCTWYWKNHSFDYVVDKMLSLLFTTISGLS